MVISSTHLSISSPITFILCHSRRLNRKPSFSLVDENMLSASMSGGVGRGRAPQKKEHQNPAQAQNVTSNSSGTLQAGLMPLMARYF